MKIELRKFRKRDLVDMQNLICRTFKKFNGKEGTKKTIQNYLDYHNPRKNLDNLRKFSHKFKISFVAISNKKVIGVIRGEKSRIKNLFVDGKFHRKGVAKKLVELFEKESKQIGSKKIKIISSIYAISFYQKMGYKKTTGLRNLRGLQIQPMEKKL